MTDAALGALSQDEDGFLLIRAHVLHAAELAKEENTDTFGHASHAATAMHAMASFEESVECVLGFQREDPDRPVVIVADHDTGGMTVEAGLGGDREATPAVLRDFIATAAEMAGEFDAAEPRLDPCRRGELHRPHLHRRGDRAGPVGRRGCRCRARPGAERARRRALHHHRPHGYRRADLRSRPRGLPTGSTTPVSASAWRRRWALRSRPPEGESGAPRFEVISLLDAAFGTTLDEGSIDY